MCESSGRSREEGLAGTHGMGRRHNVLPALYFNQLSQDEGDAVSASACPAPTVGS